MLKKFIKNKGFTLIEIIVVIVILAVLMAVAVPSVMSYMSEGQKAKYETIARAALINTQTGVAEDGKANDCLHVAIWVEGLTDSKYDHVYDNYGQKKSYGDNVKNIFVDEIFLTGNDNSSNRDVKSILLYIRLVGDSGYREVNVTTNGKMTVADSNVSIVPGHGTAVHYNEKAKW